MLLLYMFAEDVCQCQYSLIFLQKAEPVKADTSSSDSDDDWEVVRSEDGSIKKYLPKSNRKSIVIRYLVEICRYDYFVRQ